MKHFLIRQMEGVILPRIADYGKIIHYEAFQKNRPHEMQYRTLCTVENEADYGDLLMEPFPMFSENAMKALGLFLWDQTNREFILLDTKGKSHIYSLPFFRRLSGSVILEEGSEEKGGNALVTLKERLPEDLPIVYVDAGENLYLMARIDLVESLIRNGLCGVRLRPVCFGE